MRGDKRLINFIIAWVLIIFAIKIVYEVIDFSVKLLNNF